MTLKYHAINGVDAELLYTKTIITDIAEVKLKIFGFPQENS